MGLPQLLFTILLFSPLLKTIAKNSKAELCLGHQQTLLLEMRKQLVFNSSLSTNLVLWNEADNCCRWEGVECDGRGRVVRLDLYNEGISGGLDESSSLFGLEYLEELDLSENASNGSEIPREFHKLMHLTSLDLSSSSLTGQFPQIIFHLPSLQVLFVSDNPLLQGAMPQFSRNNSFQSIVLSNTSFSGSFPDSISNLKSLSRLDLSHCNFSGSIPSTLSNLTRLVDVDLSDNFFTGSIPSIHFQNLSNLRYMYLGENSLRGTIPISVFSLPSLELLDLHGNQFSGQVGEFPIVNISRLSALDLSSNRLESPIPISYLFNLQNLDSLLLSNNRFSDNFQLEKILSFPKLTYLDLSNNNLSLDDSTTKSPAAAAKQSSLRYLDLSNNRIGGDIPSWIWDIEPLRSLNLSCNMLVDLQKRYNVSASRYLDVLDLHSNKLRGESPFSFVTHGARYADLSNNRLSGPFPTSICSTAELEVLDLSSNNLSGRIPDCLFEKADSLQVLNLGTNRISGHIPDKFTVYSSLKSLDLSDNNLVGDVPRSLANSIMLEVLNLSGNKLSGTIPTNLEKLAVMNLGRNNMTGSIPNFAADCPLQYLVLNNNNFTGEVPTSLANCKQLQVMNVGNNQIEDSFPCMLPSSLQVLVLRSNRFHGEVTCRKNQSWPNLQIIDIASNHFSGYLNPLNLSTWRGMMRDTVTKLSHKTLGFNADDKWDSAYYREEVTLTINGVERKIVKIWPYYTSIDFSNNSFYGGIPDSIGGRDGLYLLNISHNSLTGTIPKSTGNLTLLVSLDLSTNWLTGEIPKEIAGLSFLAAMNVSHNELVGQIPASTQIQSFPADCFEGNLGLCGLPLNVRCSNPHPVLPPNVESEREIAWEYVFAAAGYAVGLGSFSWLLLFCRSFRYKYFDKIEDVCDKIFGFCQHRKKKHGGRRVFRK